MLLPPVALAVPVAEVAESPDLPRRWRGVLHHEGHGPRPGHRTENPFVATVGPDGATWEGEGWSERVWWASDVPRSGDPWKVTDLHDVLPKLIAHPGVWARWLARHPDAWSQEGDHIALAVDGKLATVRFDTVDRGSLELREQHPVFGEVTLSATWSPDRVDLRWVEEDTRWTAELTPDPSPVELELPAPERVTAVELAPGLHLLEVPEADSRVVLAAHGAEGVLLDAPLSSELGYALLSTAKRLHPEVRRWEVVVSHHHYVGGLRPWVRAGASVSAPEGIRAWLQEELGQTRPQDDSGLTTEVAGIASPVDRLDGRLRLIPVGTASGHTDHFVVALWTPTGHAYVADLASRPEGAPPRHRGTWPSQLADQEVSTVISGFPLARDATFPWVELVAQ